MEVTPFSISKHLSELIGRHVAVAVNDSVEFDPQSRVACYEVLPMQGTAIVKLDFHLLASMGGMMIGFPDAEIKSQMQQGKLDENLTDAAGEVMNVLSAVIVSDGRAIFRGLHREAREFSTRAGELLGGGFYPLKLSVTPTGFPRGCMSVVSDVL